MNAIHSWSFLHKARGFAVSHPAEIVCALVLCVMAVNFVAVISRKGLTNDEKYHIPAGYYHLVFGDFQLNPEHPPLAKLVSALPLLFVRPAAPPPSVGPTENPILQGHDAFQAFWEANPVKLEPLSFWPRIPMIIISLLLGIVVFSYTRYVGGNTAAMLAVIMFTLEPTILAHGRVVQTDVPAAFAYFLFFFVLQRFVDLPNTSRAVALGLVTGMALVTKFSIVIIVPVFVIALLAIALRDYKRSQNVARSSLKLAASVIAALLVINAAYYFQRASLLPNNREAVVQEWPAHVTALSRSFHAASTIIPSTYLFGVFVVVVHNDWGHYASLMGNYSRTGWWYYFPAAFALKTTIPFLLISIASLVWTLLMVVHGRERKLLLPLLAIALYTLFSMNSRINIGVRHFLPVFPFLMLLGGVLLEQLLGTKYRRVVLVCVLVLFSWMAVETIRTFPNYIPYMNQLASAHPHWYYLSDSNVEWGDDTDSLAEYLLDRGETRVRAALLGGWLSKPKYGVEYVNVLTVDQPVEQTRYIAIGASYLNGSTVPLIRYQDGRPITEEQRRDFFAAYRDREPDAVFGKSIYLFRESN